MRSNLLCIGNINIYTDISKEENISPRELQEVKNVTGYTNILLMMPNGAREDNGNSRITLNAYDIGGKRYLQVPEGVRVLIPDPMPYNKRPPDKYHICIKLSEITRLGRELELFNLLQKDIQNWELHYFSESIEIYDTTKIPVDFLFNINAWSNGRGEETKTISNEVYLLPQVAGKQYRLPVSIETLPPEVSKKDVMEKWAKLVLKRESIISDAKRILTRHNLRIKTLWSLGNNTFLPKDAIVSGRVRMLNIGSAYLRFDSEVSQMPVLFQNDANINSADEIDPTDVEEIAVSNYGNTLCLGLTRGCITRGSKEMRVWGKDTQIKGDSIIISKDEKQWVTDKSIVARDLIILPNGQRAGKKDLGNMYNQDMVYPATVLVTRSEYLEMLKRKFTVVPSRPERFNDEQLAQAQELALNPDLIVICEPGTCDVSRDSKDKQMGVPIICQSPIVDILQENLGLNIGIKYKIEMFLESSGMLVGVDCAGNKYYTKDSLSLANLLRHPLEAQKLLPGFKQYLQAFLKVKREDVQKSLMVLL